MSTSFELSPEAKFRFDAYRMPVRADAATDGRADAGRCTGRPNPGCTKRRKSPGVIVGHRHRQLPRRRSQTGRAPVEDIYMLEPGDDVVTITCQRCESSLPVYDRFVVTDYFKSEMSEYDATTSSCRSITCSSCAPWKTASPASRSS